MNLIDQLKAKYPELRDIPDRQLAESLYRRKGPDFDKSQDEYFRDIGFSGGGDAGNPIGNYARAATQGLTFGFGDEIEAGISSALGRGSYGENVARIRNQIDEFREVNPVGAIAAEFAGGVIPGVFTGGAGLAASAGRSALKAGGGQLLRRAAATGAAQGALAGAGSSEGGIADRATGAAIGGAAGGLVGAALGAVPGMTQEARQALKAGLPITPLRSFGGTGAAAEDALATLPFAGDFIRNAQGELPRKVRFKLFQQAMKPIGGAKEIKESMTTREMLAKARELKDEAYERALDGASLPDPDQLQVKIIERALEASEGDPDLAAGIFEVSEKFLNRLNFITDGASIKRFDGDLKDLISKLKGGTAQQRAVAQFVSDARDEFFQALDGSEGLKAANRAYALLMPIQKAMLKNRDEGQFSLSQFESALSQNARRQRREAQYAQGQLPQQGILDTAKRYYGKSLPDSGTETRRRILNMITGAGPAAASLLGAPLLGANIFNVLPSAIGLGLLGASYGTPRTATLVTKGLDAGLLGARNKLTRSAAAISAGGAAGEEGNRRRVN